jgi:hypothetical protein
MKPGFYRSLPAEQYHLDPCEAPSLNYSTAKAIVQDSPWHAWSRHPRLGGNKFTATPKMDLGSIAHALLLRQPIENVEIINADNFKKKAAQNERKEAKEAGKLVVLQYQIDDLYIGLSKMRANLAAAGVHLDGDAEMTAIWNADCTCRTRMDHISKDKLTIQDLKCTASANPQFLERHIVEMCYDIQAAAEIEAVETLEPELEGRVGFSDVFIEIEEPYFVVVADHSESMLSLGRARWHRAKRKWIECLETNEWAGFSNRMIVHAPNYAMSKEFGDAA